jgi:hypothetical protein
VTFFVDALTRTPLHKLEDVSATIDSAEQANSCIVWSCESLRPNYWKLDPRKTARDLKALLEYLPSTTKSITTQECEGGTNAGSRHGVGW